MTDREERPARARPWLMRTYAGHSTAKESNALFRRNLAKGQTGLSVAFDLPTQTGYDADPALASGEVGRVGVPVGHLGDMRALFDGIPLEQTGQAALDVHRNLHHGKVAVLCLSPREGLGVRDPELRARHLTEINRFRNE